MTTVEYNNLSQTLGDLPACYLRSTDVEQRKWHRLLWSIPDDWLFQWYKGNNILVHELTSNKSGGKIKRIFTPVALIILRHIILGEQLPKKHALMQHIDMARGALIADGHLLRRFEWWKGKIQNIGLEIDATIVAREPNPMETKCH